MKKFLSITVIFALFSMLIVSCDHYNQIVKSDDYQAKFDEANRLYDAGKYERCVGLFEQVYQRSPKSPQGEVSYYRMGMACFKVEDWYLASYYLSSFQLKFPYSKLVEETTYLAAMCAVYNSPKSSLDQTETEVALDELQNFITRFPNSERVDTCNIVMNSLRFKLQTKEVMNVRLYSKTGNYRAAVVSAKSYLETYPVTQYREEVYAILLRNQKLLAENSIDTKLEERIVDAEDTYANFLAEFPESLYLREFDNYLMQVRELRVKKTTE